MSILKVKNGTSTGMTNILYNIAFIEMVKIIKKN